jgi:hypothetical protein
LVAALHLAFWNAIVVTILVKRKGDYAFNRFD